MSLCNHWLFGTNNDQWAEQLTRNHKLDEEIDRSQFDNETRDPKDVKVIQVPDKNLRAHEQLYQEYCQADASKNEVKF